MVGVIFVIFKIAKRLLNVRKKGGKVVPPPQKGGGCEIFAWQKRRKFLGLTS